MDHFIVEKVIIPLEDGTVKTADVYIKDGKFHEISPSIAADGIPRISVPADWRMLPGFIDLHIHGAGGCDVMDAEEEALDTIARTLPAEGTTSFLATTMTQHPDAISNALKTAARYHKNQTPSGQAEMLGIHLEGPFISKKKAGAQPTAHIAAPDKELLAKWVKEADGQIRIATIAPEVHGGLTIIKELAGAGIIPSLGHSDATGAETEKAIEAGAAHVTHLYNQMSSFQHREPGLAGTALTDRRLQAELIADFVHSHPSAVKLAIRSKGIGHIILITDAMRAKGLADGSYDLGGQQVNVHGPEARLADGTLAGSVLTMDQAFRNVKGLMNLSDAEMISLTSANAARAIGLFDRKGSVSEGKDADFVLLDRHHCIQKTVCKGILKG